MECDIKQYIIKPSTVFPKGKYDYWFWLQGLKKEMVWLYFSNIHLKLSVI